MKTDQDVVRALAAVRMKQHLRYVTELNNQTDRGAVLVGSAYLETKLEELLGSGLASNQTIFSALVRERTAPLRGFWAKIELSYLLGLVGKDVRDSLNTIRNLRNDFAHSYESMTFESREVRSKIKGLPCRGRAQCEGKTPRWVFMHCIRRLGLELGMRKLEARRPTAHQDELDEVKLEERLKILEAQL